MSLKKLLVLILVVVLCVSVMVGCNKKGVNGDNSNLDTTETDVTGNTDTKESREVKLLVSAAASLTDVMKEIETAYKENNPNTEVTFTFEPSGGLQSQIEEGAPVDVFVSAAEKQMDALEEKDLILKDTRKTLLVNKVVLITPKDSKLGISKFEDILKSEVEKIAIGDPSNVPVGQYSEEIFNNLEMIDAVQPKLVLGNDVRTVLTWAESGEVDCGLVYVTDAFTSDKVTIITEAPEGSHKIVTYPVAVVSSSKEAEESKRFVDFLSTDRAKEIFENYGFTMD